MHRFYLPEVPSDTSIVLSDREAHHAANVLRLRKDDAVTVLNGRGGDFRCEVQEVSKKQVVLRLIQKNCVPALPFQITLLQAIPKGKLIESIIQKATELGVTRIVPLLTERVITQVGDDRAEVKREKWQQVAIEAIKQCGQTWLPKVEAPQSPSDFLLKAVPLDLPLIASLQPGARPPREFFSAFQKQHQRIPQSISIWVGPEGDFTQSEVEEVISAGALPISLGRLVLRCETAAIYCLSVINYELQAQL